MSLLFRAAAFVGLALAIAGAATPASARRAFTVQQVLELCRHYERDLRRVDRAWDPHTLMCTSYWTGVLDAVAAFDGVGEHNRTAFAICLPERLSLMQAHTTFVRYARSHPQALRTPAVEAALAAFRESHACR